MHDWKECAVAGNLHDVWENGAQHGRSGGRDAWLRPSLGVATASCSPQTVGTVTLPLYATLSTFELGLHLYGMPYCPLLDIAKLDNSLIITYTGYN